MKLFIDTEFNGFQGELISMGIVDERDMEFYEVVSPASNYHPWVAENVVPVLGQSPILHGVFKLKLQKYLMSYPHIQIIADWPEDIAHFCQAMITGPGMCIKTPPMTMDIIPEIGSSESLTPHNAIADARAIKLAYAKLVGGL